MIKNLKVLCIIQARMTSSRLPKKTLASLNGIPAIIRMVNRVLLSKFIDEIVIATGVSEENNILEDTIKSHTDILYKSKTPYF